MFKHFTIYILTALVGCLVSCKKIGKLKEFDLHYSHEVTIPSAGAIMPLPFEIVTPETTTNTKEDYKNEGTTSKLIDRVTLKDLSLIVKSPSSGNFDFLKSIEIYLASPNHEEILVASKYEIPETG